MVIYPPTSPVLGYVFVYFFGFFIYSLCKKNVYIYIYIYNFLVVWLRIISFCLYDFLVDFFMVFSLKDLNWGDYYMVIIYIKSEIVLLGQYTFLFKLM